jgi:hypothetical protein
MGAVALLPLGCPNRHIQEMYSSAVRMVQDPLASGAEARAEERRLGCLMLSCLACNLPLPMLEVCTHFPASSFVCARHTSNDLAVAAILCPFRCRSLHKLSNPSNVERLVSFPYGKFRCLSESRQKDCSSFLVVHFCRYCPCIAALSASVLEHEQE